MKLDEKKAVSLLEHVCESCGVRKTSRLVGVNKNTVMRYSRLAGEHAKKLHDEAAHMKERLHAEMRRRHDAPSDRGGDLGREMKQLRQEVQELREMVRELMARLKAHHHERE